jgi:hypothetical protein
MEQKKHPTSSTVGKCRVPMWMGGCPSGFCGEAAYGVQVEGREARDAWTGELRRLDGKYSGYSSGLACPRHAGPEKIGPRVFEDGKTPDGYRMWCAVYEDFENLQESPAEFHRHAWVAVSNLTKKHPRKIPIT